MDLWLHEAPPHCDPQRRYNDRWRTDGSKELETRVALLAMAAALASRDAASCVVEPVEAS
jgi:hypothetical protein